MADAIQKIFRDAFVAYVCNRSRKIIRLSPELLL